MENGFEELKEIDLKDFVKGEPGEPKEEPGEDKEEPTEEPDYVEVSLSTQMLISLVGMALSMRYFPDSQAIKAFSKKYREELPKVIESYGLEEVFDEVLSSTLTFKIQKSEFLTIPLPGWAGLVVVISVLVVAGLFIRVPTRTEKAKEPEEEGEKHEPKT